MKQALLDYPWSILDTLDGNSPAWNVLQGFDALIKERKIQSVPFIAREQLDDYWRGPFPGTSSAWAILGNIAERLCSQTDQECQALPVPEVDGLSAAWKCSLREAMEDLEDWRNPQIIISRSRRSAWEDQFEISIQFMECLEEPQAGPYRRLLVRLEEYDLHPFALSDFDPWNLMRIHPIPDPGLMHLAHPCLLPKPPELADIRLEQLIDTLRQLKLRDSSKHYYVPPRDWDPYEVSKDHWRRGRAFPYSDKDGHRGFIDAQEVIWEWDDAERHWDVQTNPYKRISHNGDEIGG